MPSPIPPPRIGITIKKNVCNGSYPNSIPTDTPAATAAAVPTSSGMNMRMKPCTRILWFIPRMLPATRHAMYKYCRLAVFMVVVTAFIISGSISLSPTRADGTNRQSIAAPPMFLNTGIRLPISANRKPASIITAKPPIMSLGRRFTSAAVTVSSASTMYTGSGKGPIL